MVNTGNPPEGYIFRAAPRSVQEAVSQASHDRIKSITKQAIQYYIEQFMDTSGVKRSITEAIGSISKLFITDKDILVTDPTLRQTQLARYFNDIRERLPAILIIDSGMEWVDPGLNVLDHVTNFGPKGQLGQPTLWQGQFPLTYNIPISIVAAAGDQESADALGSLLTLFFGPMRNIGGGSRISGRLDKGDTWEVRLPLTFSPSPTTNSAINDDPKDSVWAMTIDMLVQFEDRITLQQEIPQIAFPPTSRVNIADLAETLAPIIHFPDSMKIYSSAQILVTQIQDNQKIILSNGNLATFDPENLLVTARRLGKFQIQVVDLNRRQPTGAALAPKVIASKEVEVVL